MNWIYISTASIASITSNCPSSFNKLLHLLNSALSNSDTIKRPHLLTPKKNNLTKQTSPYHIHSKFQSLYRDFIPLNARC